MKIVDLNVLLYAVNSDAAQHRIVRKWWEDAVNSGDSIGLPWVVLLGFLRISTNPRVFPKPLRTEDAVGKVDTWLAVENVRVIREQDNHWEVLRALVSESGTAGNLTTDAHLAAPAISHAAVLVSSDSDIRRFKGLRWHNPLA